MDTQNQNNDDQWIQIADQTSDIIPTSTDFSLINTPGPVDCVSKDSKRHEYFLHLFGEEFLDTVVADTNLFAERKITSKGNLGSSCRFRKWKSSNREELLAFFGLTINMGLINKSNINAYWNSKDWSQSTPAFGAVFTRDRFLMLHSMLHFPENERDTGKLKKVQNLVQYFNEQFRNYYEPKKNVSTEESLIGYEGRGPGIQYMPNKHHHRFRFKLFCLCESESGYTYNFSIYEGKQSSSSEYGISHDICIELMAPLLGQEYHLFTDNWYTAVPLAESLLLEGTNLTGTVRSNRKYLPAGVKKKLAKGETVAFRKNRLLCMGWPDKNHVILISTEGSSKMITHTSKQKREHQVPEIAGDYNLFMGGVDLSDMPIYMFLDERRTIGWNKKVFLGRLILNSFIIYQQNTTRKS